ncbi:hypothetical protein PIB30_101681, partial [Stylosanthes scabra]|nr:hypothetical protein [Stylosanthes scabra]
MEGQGENKFTAPCQENVQKQGDQFQQQHMEDSEQHLEVPAYNMEVDKNEEVRSITSHSVNQPAALINKGKEKEQDTEEQVHANKESRNKGKQKQINEEEQYKQLPIKEALKQVSKNKITKFVDQEVMRIFCNPTISASIPNRI